jgi:hypothetical protein
MKRQNFEYQFSKVFALWRPRSGFWVILSSAMDFRVPKKSVDSFMTMGAAMSC